MFRWRKKKCDLASLKREASEFELAIAMKNHGWRFWPANATEEEIQAAISLYIQTGEHRWYAPGETEMPIVTEGKLIVKEEK